MIELISNSFNKAVYHVIKDGDIHAFTKYESTQTEQFKGCIVVVSPEHIPIYFRVIK